MEQEQLILKSKINTTLKEHLKDSKLPEFYFEYMAGMIQEEPPANGKELFDLLAEFIQNGNNISKENCEKICQILSSNLIENQLIRLENKLKIQAEKLDAPITLNEFDLMGEQDPNSNYLDAFLGIEKLKIDEENKYQENSKTVNRKREREEKKAQEAFERHMVELQNTKKMLPPTQVRHNRDMTKSKDIQIDNITLIIGGKSLLDNAKINLIYGRKYGLVGRNGIGKTCLMTAFARGDFDKLSKGHSHVQILLVEQEVAGDDRTVLQTILETDSERETLLKKEKELEQLDTEQAAKEIQEVWKRLEEIDAFQAESKAATILAGLGFTPEMQVKKTKFLSGGWRMRVSLARALFVQPDILLLDEPTNHLDLDAVMWLEDYLVNCKTTVVVVSHAREFLNVVCTDTIHFFDFKLNYYKGNYDTFEKTRYEKIQNQKKQAEAQKMRIDHVQKFIDKFRYNAKRATLVQSRIKALQKMELVEDVLEDPSVVFIFPTPDKLRPPLMKIDDGCFGYSNTQILLRNLNFGVDMESRVAIVGANGVGKSTFLKLLHGELSLQEGIQFRHGRLRISIFTQHHIDLLDLIKSPLEQFTFSFPGHSIESYRSHLGSFGITGNLQLRPQYLLSGGQKSRVAFAMCVWNNPHILILDEPTNHLDIDAVNALIVALNNYQGGVLIVSHDQHLIASVCDHIWYIRDYRLRKFNGDFEDYRKSLAAGRL